MALVCVITAAFHGVDDPGISATFVVSSQTGSAGEVFFSGNHAGYSQHDSVQLVLIPDGKWHEYVVALPPTTIDRLRLDPGNLPGGVCVHSIQVRHGIHTQDLSKQKLLKAVGVTNQLAARPDSAQDLCLRSLGNDPYFDVALPRAVGGIGFPARVGILASIAVLTFATWMLLEWLVGRFWVGSNRTSQFRAMLETDIPSLSDEGLLKVNVGMLLIVASVLVCASFYVAFALNQSSIGVWETVYPDRPVARSVDFGTPRRIRSDEWKVMTPWVLNQVHKGNPLQNPDIGGESSPLLASAPVSGILGWSQLKFAGFHFMGVDRGMSWWWAYKSFALWLSFFWLCLLLTRGSVAASLLGATWIYVSSFTQWWFSSDLPEIMAAFALGTAGAIYALFSTKRLLVGIGCAIAFYAMANLALNLYPPFILTLGYLGVALMVGHAVENNGLARVRFDFRFRVLALLLTFLAAGLYAWSFVSAATDSIAAVMNTVYPGRRLAGSGGVPIAKVLYGVFEPFRLGEKLFPLPTASSNASEASTFVLLAPLAFLVLPWRQWMRRQNASLVAMAVFCLVALCWIAFRLPRPAEWLMQHAGWSAVTPKRAVLALGVGSILMCTVLFARIRGGHLQLLSPLIRRMAVLATLVCLSLFGWKLRQADPAFFSVKTIVIGVVAGSLMASGIAFGRIRLLLAGLMIYAVPAMEVNPLERGISALSEKPILLAATRATRSVADKWIVVGDNFFAQGLRAHGLRVFAGSQYLPDRAALSVLDPDGKSAAIWNRYATVRIFSDPAGTQPRFKVTRGDQYAIWLNICSARTRELGITLVAYTVPVPAEDRVCLQPLAAPVDSGVKLFRLKS